VICAARATSDAVTCDVLLANGRYGCACRIAVEEDQKREKASLARQVAICGPGGVSVWLGATREAREARVPDSAREAS
jgi:hypothetical protein